MLEISTQDFYHVTLQIAFTAELFRKTTITTIIPFFDLLYLILIFFLLFSIMTLFLLLHPFHSFLNYTGELSDIKDKIKEGTSISRFQ